MSFAPGILAALFGVPPLKAVAATKPTVSPDEKKEISEQTGKPTESLLKDMWGTFKNGFATPDDRMRATMVASLIVSWILFAIVLLMSIILYIKIQSILYKNSQKTAEQAIQESKKPYMDTLEYQVMDASIFTTYPYRALFYLTAVAFTLMILAYLFKIQLGQNANPGGAPSPPGEDKEASPIDKAINVGTILSLYLFFACYWVIEKSYYTKIVDYTAKITDFNQFVRSILPGNYPFLTLVSKPSDSTELDETIYKPALEALNSNKREIVRGLCILNLYTYYHEQGGNYTRPGGVANVLECFNPINRILPTAPSCFSDHLINNNSFIDNRIGKYIALLEAMPASSGAATMFKSNRTQILLDVDKMMNELNQRGSCLGSTTAYNKFLTMNTRVFLLVWIPFIFFAFKGTSSYFKKT
jgi:hypothetical protein